VFHDFFEPQAHTRCAEALIITPSVVKPLSSAKGVRTRGVAGLRLEGSADASSCKRLKTDAAGAVDDGGRPPATYHWPGVTMQSGQAQEVPLADGAMQSGQAQEVPLADGTMQSGQAQEVPLADGAMQSGQAQEVPLADGAMQSGQAQEVPLADGTMQSGQVQEVPLAETRAELQRLMRKGIEPDMVQVVGWKPGMVQVGGGSPGWWQSGIIGRSGTPLRAGCVRRTGV
jgi:hypothetical protein